MTTPVPWGTACMTIRVILIDLDGVLRHWPRPWDAASESGQRRVEDEVFKVAFAPELLHQAITGVITHDEWTAETIARLSMDWPEDDARRAVVDWVNSVPLIDSSVRELVSEWRQVVPVVLITNATSRLGRDLAVVGLDGAFDAIVNSSETGQAKPDPDIFAAALSRAGAAPDQAIFIDDSATNVEAAVALGLLGYRFDGDVDRLTTFVSGNLR